MNTNSQPLISVIIPCFNAERTVERTLDDIFRQSYPYLEIIAVDDGSQDHTRYILGKYAPKIKILTQQNRGAGAARNTGFAASQGGFLLFCDADVQLDRHMIEKMLRTLQAHPAAAYCYSNFKFGIHTFDLFPFDPDRLMKENYISTMSLIRRASFIGFDERLKKFQDWDLWKRMLSRGAIGVWHPERLFTAPMRNGISKFSWKNIFHLLMNRMRR